MTHSDIASILEGLRRSPLNAPVRLAVMVILVYRGEIEFNELQKILGVKPGLLWSHIEKLHRDGLVVYKRRFTARGPRLTIRATSKGVMETLGYIRLLRSLLSTAPERAADAMIVEQREDDKLGQAPG
ncbi:hypothetical protein Pyrfu_0596 [Pyrolobus fumarii 1A]|uniref:Winged helix DNA-binding domain-containing protein n=1 Tax=Pyrolobus fumarii (strain DSM 11204 / 1A) TaxID=694429 RepID=G0EH16_PYRF1|nr:transcriptional regulator [Pyrolobus fumarii]AEM38466.1 hypothetical protein Pyrfu_0596 [Pyrolobus fumarii 1A]